MKRLKKSLVVLLVLAMALTMVPFAGASGLTTVANFDDAAAVTESKLLPLDVMAALGILRGVDGNIQPQRNVTRAEAATIVARTLLGPAAADTLPPTTSFRDVTLTSFASGAIGYLYDHGIVVGIGDGLFNPQGYVTGAELAAMFLRAVGFGVNGEYVGPRWEVNAIVDGMQWRVLTGDADFTAPATREAVFLYAYNAMNTRESRVGLCFVNWSADRNAYIHVGLLAGDFETIYGRIFRPNPVNLLRTTPTDDFGRPSVRYTLRGIEIGTRQSEAAVTFTAFTNTAGVNAAIQGFNRNDVNVARFVNGNPNFGGIETANWWQVATSGTYAGVVAFNSTATPIATANAIPAGYANIGDQISVLTGNGVLVELFVDENTNDLTTVTVIRTDITEVTRISAGTRTFNLLTNDNTAEGGTVLRGAVFADSDALEVGALHPLRAEAEEFELDDKALITPVWRNGEWQVGAIAVPESATGVLRASASMVNLGATTGSVTIDDQVLRRARVISLGARDTHLLTVGQEVTLLLDTFGFVVDAEATAAARTDIMFVDRANMSTMVGNQVRPMLQGFWSDGTPAEVILTQTPALQGNGGIAQISRIGGEVTATFLTSHQPPLPVPAPVPPPPAGLQPVTDVPPVATGTNSSILVYVGNVGTIASGQPALNIAGTTFAFAAGAQYFYWNPLMSHTQRFVIRDRDHSVDTAAANITAWAVLEFRGTNVAPVISALYIRGQAAGELDAGTLRFMRPGGQVINVTLDGRVFTQQRSIDIFNTETHISISDNQQGNEPMQFAEVIADPQLPGAYRVAQLNNQIGTNLAIFTEVTATRNGLTGATRLFIEQVPGSLGEEATIAPQWITLTNATQIRDLTRTGAAAVSTIAMLDELLDAQEVRIAVIYTVGGGNNARLVLVY